MMKKAVFVLIVLILPLLYYLGLFSRQQTLPFSKEFFSVETPPSADRAPELKGAGLSKPEIDPRTALSDEKSLDRLYQSKLDRGVLNVPTLSLVLVREAQQARREGRPDRAIRLALYAKKFSPDLPEPYFELARARWSENPFQVHQVLPEILRGEMARFRRYPTSLQWLYNAFFIGANACLLAFMVFGIILLVKYLPLYLYDLRKNLTGGVSRLPANSIKILLLLIPFLLRLDILWAVFFWSVLLWGYVTKRERQLIIVFLIALVYLPFSLRSSSSFLDGPSSEILHEIDRANREEADRSVEQKLRTWLAAHPDDVQVLFTLGLLEKRQGRYSQAEEFYLKAIQQDPRFDEALSNLGNVYLGRNQPEQAVSSYQRAIDLNPGNGAYYYNLYRAQTQETFLSRSNDRSFQQARQLDAEKVDFYVSIDSPNPNRRMIDETLGPGRLWARFNAQFIGREGILFRLFNAWFERVPARVPFLIPALFLGLLLGMGRYSRTKRFLTRCPVCGSPTYRFYLGATDQDFVCFNCYRIFVQKEKLHPKISEKKSLQAREHERQNHLVSRVVSFFFSGFGELWTGSPVRGLLLLFVFFIFILKGIYWRGALGLAIPEVSAPMWPAVVWGALFATFYFVSLRCVDRLKPKYRTGTGRPKDV
jgi:tetratricopeptide (TPR) repeat protein